MLVEGALRTRGTYRQQRRNSARTEPNLSTKYDLRGDKSTPCRSLRWRSLKLVRQGNFKIALCEARRYESVNVRKEVFWRAAIFEFGKLSLKHGFGWTAVSSIDRHSENVPSERVA